MFIQNGDGLHGPQVVMPGHLLGFAPFPVAQFHDPVFIAKLAYSLIAPTKMFSI